MPEPVLRTDHLGRTVGDAVLVADVAIDLAPGELLGLVGPSGSGKSSLLRLLSRLDEPTTGTVYVGAVDYRTIAPRTLRRTIGMVFQRAVMFPGTVADNVRFGPRQQGEMLSDDAVHALLARVGLPDFAARDTANLSGGEAQRVSLARTLANQPTVLLLDEPTSALDEDSKAGIESLIRSLDVTGVLVTHDMAQAHRLATRIVTMNKGRLC
ncbi:MAG TPA: ATP-binding cassette domain-containing protein [Gemmatimonadaceae bacterium]|nr:ATP-binding cassette domain-containing protein [Gemmatimonadaceae bacterium]